MQNMLTHVLQPVDEDQLATLTKIARETFVDTFGHLYTTQNLDQYIKDRLSLGAIINEWSDAQTRFYLVQDESNKSVGYIKHIENSQKYLEHLPKEVERPTHSLLLERFYFIPEAQGKGIAHRAMQAWLERVTQDASLDALHLSVWEENVKAQRFYHRYGFDYSGTFGYIVGDQEDTEYIYMKRLRE